MGVIVDNCWLICSCICLNYNYKRSPLHIITICEMCQHKDFSGSQGLNFGLFIIERKNRLDCSVKVSEIIISSDVYVHIHRENATCRTRVCLKGNRNSFPWQQEVCKSFLLITVLIKYIDFVVNFIIVMLSILFCSHYKQFWGWFWLFWIWVFLLFSFL